MILNTGFIIPQFRVECQVWSLRHAADTFICNISISFGFKIELLMLMNTLEKNHITRYYFLGKKGGEGRRIYLGELSYKNDVVLCNCI